MKTLLTALTLLSLSVGVARADLKSDINQLALALELPEVIDIMRIEGVEAGNEIAEELLPDQNVTRWYDSVETIYDAEWMKEVVGLYLEEELKDTDLVPLLGFFQDGPGKEIVALEVGARRALMDDEVEKASKDNLAEYQNDKAPILDLIERYIAANDLVEFNVMTAMNSNYAFYSGLADGAVFADTLTEEQILSDVWAQEEDIRTDTHDWLLSFMAMAYQPVSTKDLEAYIAISDTPEGRDLNRALFSAFDKMFVQISGALGRSAAKMLEGEDL